MNTNPRLLIIDDDPLIIESISGIMSDESFDITYSGDANEAFDLCKNTVFNLILCDLRMPGTDGLDFLKMLRREGFTPSVVMMSGSGSIDSAVEAMKLGAVDYISKPFDKDRLLHIINKELKFRSLNHVVSSLQNQVRDKYKFDKIISKNPKMHRIFEKLLMVSKTNTTVLIQGETGTGKELIANSIHANSERCDGPFIAVNMASLAESLLESELFGHVKGAFTGAMYDKKGKFEMADHGTIFLDEIGDLPPLLQVKLLRVLQEKSFEKVGGTKTIHVNIRIISATNKDLQEEMENRHFRSDLYYRLNIFPILVPPLRDRKEDIPLLTSYFLKSLENVTNKKVNGVSPTVLDKLMKYTWPGNVRELENVIERALVTEKSDVLTDVDTPVYETAATGAGISSAEIGDIKVQKLDKYMDDCEKQYISTLLSQNQGSVGKTASEAGINENTLYKKMKKLNLRKEEYKFSL